jgi:hypothetical protein
MGGLFSSARPKRLDDHAISTHKAIERRMISHNTHGNVASIGVHKKGRRARRHRERQMVPSRTRSVISGPTHGPRGAVQPPHRIRRNAAHHAMSIPSAKKQHKRRDTALKTLGFLSDVSQAAFKNKLMFG